MDDETRTYSLKFENGEMIDTEELIKIIQRSKMMEIMIDENGDIEFNSKG